jgi:DNA-binding response OmpR family regulator
MPQTLMIAVNDPNIHYLLQRYAEESGFETVRTTLNDDVLDLAKQSKPALIILEMGCPEVEGQGILRGLKTCSVTRDIPVVAYSCLEEEIGDPSDDLAGILRSVMYADFIGVLEIAGVRPEGLAQ